MAGGIAHDFNKMLKGTIPATIEIKGKIATRTKNAATVNVSRGKANASDFEPMCYYPLWSPQFLRHNFDDSGYYMVRFSACDYLDKQYPLTALNHRQWLSESGLLTTNTFLGWKVMPFREMSMELYRGADKMVPILLLTNIEPS